MQHSTQQQRQFSADLTSPKGFETSSAADSLSLALIALALTASTFVAFGAMVVTAWAY